VNEELTRSHGECERVSEHDLPSRRRPADLHSWCCKRGLETPGRRAIAHRIVEGRAGGSLVTSKHKNTLAELYRRVCAVLGMS
jgi:hypothetical protein